jgi:hypothetical protein
MYVYLRAFIIIEYHHVYLHIGGCSSVKKRRLSDFTFFVLLFLRTFLFFRFFLSADVLLPKNWVTLGKKEGWDGG